MSTKKIQRPHELSTALAALRSRVPLEELAKATGYVGASIKQFSMPDRASAAARTPPDRLRSILATLCEQRGRFFLELAGKLRNGRP